MTIQNMLDDAAGVACKVFYDAGQMNQAADCFNASLGRGVVSSTEAWELTVENGTIAALEVAAKADNEDALTLLEMLRPPEGVDYILDLDAARMSGRLNRLQTGGHITTAQQNQLVALGDGKGSLAITHLGRPVRARELGEHKKSKP